MLPSPLVNLPQECLPIRQLQCNTTRHNPTVENNQLLAGPCRTCIKGAIRVWATARAEDYFKKGASTGGVQAASSAVAPIPVVSVGVLSEHMGCRAGREAGQAGQAGQSAWHAPGKWRSLPR